MKFWSRHRLFEKCVVLIFIIGAYIAVTPSQDFFTTQYQIVSKDFYVREQYYITKVAQLKPQNNEPRILVLSYYGKEITQTNVMLVYDESDDLADARSHHIPFFLASYRQAVAASPKSVESSNVRIGIYETEAKEITSHFYVVVTDSGAPLYVTEYVNGKVIRTPMSVSPITNQIKPPAIHSL